MFQLFVGIVGLPLLKITQSTNEEDSPFFGDKYKNMGFLKFAATYTDYGFSCILNLEKEDNVFSNYGDCHNGWIFVFGYTVSLFIIQLTLNSLMSYKFTRYVKIIYAFMIPITLLAFLLAKSSIEFIDPKNVEFNKFDMIGLSLVAIGVYMQNWFRENKQ